MTDSDPLGPRQTFAQQQAEANAAATRLGSVLAALTLPAGIGLDYFLYPERLREFFWIRLTAAFLCILILPAMRLPAFRRQPGLAAGALSLICQGTIIALIWRLGGPSSPYYAGLNAIILALCLLYNWEWKYTALFCGFTIFLWLLPLVGSSSVDRRAFGNNLYFLLLTSLLATATTAVRFRSARNEFNAREKLARTSSELSQTLLRLQELDRLKSEFFANISHELRTPLTLILAPVEDLLARSSKDAPHGTLLVIRRNAERLLRLIDDLLDLGRLEVGGLRLNVGKVDVRALTSNVIEACRPTAEARGISLELDSPDTVPQDLFGDPHRLEMILTNLVGNALKFTPAHGHITVSVRAEAGGIAVNVTDDGPGIPRADLERVFERFYQVEGSLRRKHGGTGIGLALARELAVLHEGTLTVDSVLGEGSSFRLWLPLGQDHFRPEAVERRRVRMDDHAGRRTEDRISDLEMPVRDMALADVVSPHTGPAATRARILVVEDEPDLRTFIRAILEREFSVLEAATGSEGLAMVRSERPDLVISDIMMPETSGIDLCRTIKEDAALRTTPVILLTARTGSESALDGYSSGADDFVTKPFHARLLVARARAQLRIRALGLQLANQARLSLAATLAAGMAHEVRNPLNALMNAAELLLTSTKDPATTTTLLRVIHEGARRVADVVSALDDHARPADGEGVSTLDVAGGLDSALTLLKPRLADVQVHRTYETRPLLMVPAREFNQVFLNILDNAIRARPRNIWIRIGDTPSGVRLTIADDGPGIPPDIAERIFDPFFTTRPIGQGTGLGLYLSRRIVTEHGGDLRLEKNDGGGATFALDLPAVHTTKRVPQTTAASAPA